MALNGVENLVIAYGKSVREVYAGWAPRHVERTKTLDVLAFRMDCYCLGLSWWVLQKHQKILPSRRSPMRNPLTNTQLKLLLAE